MVDQFEFDGGILRKIEFDWVRGGGGRGVRSFWWRFVRGKTVGQRYCCGGFCGLGGKAELFSRV